MQHLTDEHWDLLEDLGCEAHILQDLTYCEVATCQTAPQSWDAIEHARRAGIAHCYACWDSSNTNTN